MSTLQLKVNVGRNQWAYPLTEKELIIQSTKEFNESTNGSMSKNKGL